MGSRRELWFAVLVALVLVATSKTIPPSVYSYQCLNTVEKGPINLDLPAEFSGNLYLTEVLAWDSRSTQF